MMDNVIILGQDRNLRIKWEDTHIDIPLNFENTNEAILYQAVNKLQTEVTHLNKKLIAIRYMKRHPKG